MAYFSKEIYDRKNGWAENNQWESAEKAFEKGLLDEEDVRVLTEIARIRHNIHSTDRTRLFNAECSDYEMFTSSYDRIRELIKGSALPEFKSTINMDSLPCSEDYWLFDYDEDYDSYSDWFEVSGIFDDFCEKVEEYNKEIEDYLAGIDKKFGTSFCPKGHNRIYDSEQTR